LLIRTLLAVGIPLITCVGLNLYSLGQMRAKLGSEFGLYASNLGDLVDRNLFERYGDVQAFGYNEVLFERDSWYKRTPEENRISARMNDYIKAYVIYSFMMLVDINGQVIAASSVDEAGRPVSSSHVFDRNYAKESWFQNCLNGKFYTAPGMLTGTVLEDFYIDEDVRRIYNNDGLTIGFSAPVYDKNGKPIGVWKNMARFSLVEDMMKQLYGSVTKAGYRSTHIAIVNEQGQYLSQFNPSSGSSEFIHSSANSGRNSLDVAGVPMYKGVLVGNSGYAEAWMPEQQEYELVGYSRLKGALGFRGMPWSTLVQVSGSEVYSGIHQQQRYLILIMFMGLVLAVVWTSQGLRTIVGPLSDLSHNLSQRAGGIRQVAQKLSSQSQDLSSGSTQQAASIQETVAATAEMTSMLAKTAERSRASQDGTAQMLDQLDAGRKTMSDLTSAMSELERSNGQLSSIISIIKDIRQKTRVIHDIVFKTQLLSFNASIEAARAGTHGRGFAVVASEVGNLADMSGHAARDIEDLLERSEREVGEIVDMTEDRTRQGKAVTAQSTKLFDSLAREVESVSRAIGDISEAAREQQVGMQQTSNAMTQIDHIAQQVRDLASETARIGTRLGGEEKNLARVIGDLDKLINGDGSNKGTDVSVSRDEGSRGGESKGGSKLSAKYLGGPNGISEEPARETTSIIEDFFN
jgi:methyl-accepting chemotaxis protein